VSQGKSFFGSFFTKKERLEAAVAFVHRRRNDRKRRCWQSWSI
jgi:hypothetical protein